MTKLTVEESKLVEKNHNLIYSFMKKYKLPFDDWYDLCAIGLIKAVKNYRSDDISFSTFAYTCMKNEMCNEIVYRERHSPQALSLDYTYENSKGESYQFEDFREMQEIMEDKIVDNIYANELFTFFDSQLKRDIYKKAIKLLSDGENVLVVSKKIGVSHQALEQQLDKLYRKYIIRFKPDHYGNRGRKNKINKVQGIAGS